MDKKDRALLRRPQDVLSRFGNAPRSAQGVIDLVYPIGCVIPSDEASGPGKLYPGTVWKKVSGEGIAFFKRIR